MENKPKTTRKTRPAVSAVARGGTHNNNDAPAPTHEQIALRAHELYVRSGHQPGRDQEFWLEAERQLKEETKPLHV